MAKPNALFAIGPGREQHRWPILSAPPRWIFCPGGRGRDKHFKPHDGQPCAECGSIEDSHFITQARSDHHVCGCGRRVDELQLLCRSCNDEITADLTRTVARTRKA